MMEKWQVVILHKRIKQYCIFPYTLALQRLPQEHLFHNAS
ncbi:hypothetical protein HMPREF9406_2827 [Clostridium sp. HGF2]|nr:hypothetical protein HMPREF9406_2827 [Clostridium sp. HGF2]